MAIRVQEHVPLRELTTLKVGGTARFFCSVSTEQNLQTAFRFARKKKLPVVILGGGSNVLLSDTELNAVVVKNEIRGVVWESPLIKGALPSSAGGLLQPPAHQNASAPFGKGDTVLVISGAGENWDGLVAEAVKRGLWGIENLSGIPGTVGAAPIQNIGAYGTELKDVLAWVEVLDNTNYEQGTKVRTETVRRISNAECRFGYRDSIFKHPEGKGLIVIRVALRLQKNGVPNLAYKDLQTRFAASTRNGSTGSPVEPLTLSVVRRAVLQIRSRKFPDLTVCGTAGSFFKNPIIPKKQFDELKKRFPNLPGFPLPLQVTSYKLQVKVSLAWILDNICDLKGYKKGNVALFAKQPIVLVNIGGATAEEIKRFSDEVTRRIKEKTGITIQNEVIHIS